MSLLDDRPAAPAAADAPAAMARLAEAWIDAAPVTVADYARFVRDTGYRTEAELAGAPAVWHRPGGPASDVRGRSDEPVAHLSAEDAAAYAAWVGKALPTDAELAEAARGGIVATDAPRAGWRCVLRD